MYIIKYFKHNNDIKAYIFLLLTAIFMLGANPFKSETIAPMDILQSRLGWQNVNIQVPHIHPARGDILDAKLPRWIEAKKHIYNADVPLWNYVTAGGQPLSSMFTESIYTPAFLVFALIKNNATAFYFSNLTNILIGLFGMYLFLRIFFSHSASVFGAIIFMFSGFNTAWFFWPHVNTTIWAPWVLYAVYKYINSDKKSYLPLITITMIMLNLGGFPMVAVMSYMALAILIILLLISKKYTIKRNLKIIFNLMLFSILSLMITIPIIYPLIELFSWIGGIGYRHGGGYLPISDFQLFITPNLYGHLKVEKTFYVGILPIIFLFLSVFIFFKKPQKIALYGLFLFLFSITITFSLISPDIIRMIPTLDKNPWSRFSFLIDTSLAIIAAYVLNEIVNLAEKKKWLFLIVFLLIGYQIIDQKNFFHKFNSVVPNESFYPNTKSISYLQNHLKPLQYVLADGGYLNAGTLGAYNIPEWYSHGFHSNEEKKILSKLTKNPFQTPTSAVFLCSQIDLNSKYLDYLNNKYIACSMGTAFSTELWSHKRTWAPTPVLHKNNLFQNFHIDIKQKVDAIDLYMATHGHKHSTSDIELMLYKGEKLLASSIVLKENIADYTWSRFNLSESLLLQPGDYSISIKMIDKTNAKKLSIWAFSDEKTYPLIANNKKTNLALKMMLIRERSIPDKYNIINVEPNITILENTKVKGSAYFIKTLNHNQDIIYDNIVTKISSNTQIDVSYTDTNEGWVVLPMRDYPGWHIKINGQEGKIEKFIGMLPAIRVNGVSKITLTYIPTYSKYMYLISILSILVLLFSIWKIKRKKEI